MTRHDHGNRTTSQRMFDQRIKQQSLLTLARGARDPERATVRQVRRQRVGTRVRVARQCHVELYVASHRHIACAKRSKAARMRVCLRGDTDEAPEHGARQRAAFRVTRSGALRHSRVNQPQRYVRALRSITHTGPQFRLDQEAQFGFCHAQKFSHQPRRVERQVHNRGSITQQRQRRRTTRRRGASDQHARLGEHQRVH